MEEKIEKNKYGMQIKILIGLITVILIVFMFPRGESIESELTVGSIWTHEDLIAPFSFPIEKDLKVYQQELKDAAQSVYPVFLKSGNAEIRAEDSLKTYNEYLLRIIEERLSIDSLKNMNPTFLSDATLNTLEKMRNRTNNNSESNTFSLRNYFTASASLLTDLYKKEIISLPEDITRKDSIAVRTGNFDRIEPANKFLTKQQAEEIIDSNIKNSGFTPELSAALLEYTSHFIYSTLIYNQKKTEEEIAQAKNNVSRYSGIVNENERIVAKHDRITKETKLKIDSYKAAKGEKLGYDSDLLQMLGKVLHIGFLLALLSIYLYLFRKKIFYDNRKLLLLVIIFIFLSFITFLINRISVNAPLQFFIFIPAASMLLTIIFDSRVGFYSTVILALITGGIRGNDYTFMAMNLFAGALSVYTVRDIKNRSQIFRSFLFILLGYVVSISAFGLERFASAENMLIEYAFAGTNALISPVLTYGLLIFFEKFFRITTDLTLLELSNFDRPLLKELARKAPGTFNHSMTMGTLAEAAAEIVGANPLLARVGAYYHDIGKTISPQNFVENQLNSQNLHENLSPEESVSLIKKHVAEGINLAKENDIPREIIDFIPMHHGTTTMMFFYEKAKKLYGEEKVNIEDYRYPGPKPDSKETAIIMLADGCESAVRSIEDADPTKVENLIDKIIGSRINEDQLDESPITFRDINKIKESFTSILLGQHHRRIRYPKQDEMEKGEDTESDDK
ncbi:MAG: HDIG domain-containing metalloprotein [Ignavibacteriaceae bacterium]